MERCATIIVSVCCSSVIVCLSFIMVSALKCVMMCHCEKKPLWGLWLWYQFGYVVTIIVGVCGLYMAALA